MGYYTMHELTVSDDNVNDHVAAIELVSGYSGLFEDTVKWYDRERDMRGYSKDNPSVLCELKGEGEESGDLWIEYYKSGKMQRCKAKITYADYDESKLE